VRARGAPLRAFALAFGGLLASAAAASVAVDVEPPTVTRIEFDPRDPPRDMPGDGSDGSGLCRNVFEIEAAIMSSIEVLSPSTIRAYPRSVEVTTRLAATIYTPQGAAQKLRDHEEGHRAIGAHYYLGADRAAREAAASLLGRAFDASGADRAGAEQAVQAMILAALKDAYMQRTQARSAAANARYDAITNHGRDAIAEAAAVAMAIEQDP
jgi:hypothetical protein